MSKVESGFCRCPWPALLLALSALPALALDYEVETVVAGLDHPWSLAFLPDGDLLVTERSGRLLRIDEGGALRAVAGVPEAYVRSQGGLFEVLLDPDFAANRRVYLSYAHGTPDANTLRVAAARLQGDALVDLEVLFEAQPTKDTPVHYGGRMAFLTDGTLLVTTGDGFDFREAAQRLDNHLGKTIRISRDGSVPPDNPFVGREDALPEIWTWGHRNPQGLAVDPAGTVWLHEHGPRGGDELNHLRAGANYGWPIATYGVDYNGAYVSPFHSYRGTVAPVLHWTPSIAPAGLARYEGDRFPGWDGDLLVASLAEQSVRRIDLDRNHVIGQELPFATLTERFRDVRVGPDGAIYLLTDSEDGAILRVTPTTP